MKPVKIYLLIDPITNEIRYVGKTIQPLKSRLSAHINEKSNCHRSHWIEKLKRAGVNPEIVLLEEIDGAWPWQESERFWIKYLRAIGINLTNNTSGGDGVPDLPEETRAKMRLTWLGRKHKPETIEKLRGCRKSYKHSKATKKKMSLSQRGRKITWGDKIAKGTRKLTDKDLLEITAALKKGEMVCSLAKKYHVHRTTISKVNTGNYLKKGQK